MLPVTELPVEAPVHELSMWMPDSMPSKICVAATVFFETLLLSACSGLLCYCTSFA
jgi:hypothetical protein